MAFPLAALLGLGSTLIDRLIPDKEAQAAAKLKLIEMQQTGELAELQSAASIIQAEASSAHWLTATWRPITMLVFVAIVANNYILYPYLTLFMDNAPVLEIPPDMWALLKIGIGGYVVGRSGEKAIAAWKAKPGN